MRTGKVVQKVLQTDPEEKINMNTLCSQHSWKQLQETQSHAREATGEDRNPWQHQGKRTLKVCGDDDQRMTGPYPETRSKRRLKASRIPALCWSETETELWRSYTWWTWDAHLISINIVISSDLALVWCGRKKPYELQFTPEDETYCTI